jgi:hypothetical protein
VILVFRYTDVVRLAPEPHSPGSLKGLGGLVPSTILLMGSASGLFVMALFANIPWLPFWTFRICPNIEGSR